jgi:hypothetical protein
MDHFRLWAYLMGASQQALLGGSEGDPNFSSVVLLLHMDGANGSTTYTDSSNSARATSGTTLVAQSTSQSKFGSASADFSSAASGQSIQWSDSEDWNFGSGQFTMEAWVYWVSHSTTTEQSILAQRGASTQLAFEFGKDAGNKLAFYYSTNGTSFSNVGAAYTPTLSTWVHVAVDRDASNVLRVYANGSVVAFATVAATFFNSTQTLALGNAGSLFAVKFPGYIDEVRVTKGVARYGGAFTPPALPFPNY